MADFNQPTNTSLRTNIIQWLKDLIHSSATWLDSRRTTDTNIPTYAKRWNNSTKLIEDYNGSSWSVLQIESAGVVASTTSKRGVIQLATNAEVTTGTNSDKAVVPSSLKVELDKKALLAGNSAQVFSAANATDNVHVVNRQTGDARYAALGGSATQRFKVADAVDADEATTKSQLDAHTGASAPHSGHVTTTSFNTHTDATSAHSATATPTGNRITMYDHSGRVKSNTPVSNTDTVRLIDLSGVPLTRDYTSLSSVLTVTANIPIDNTVPQSNEGTEILSITVAPRLFNGGSGVFSIYVNVPLAGSGLSTAVVALFCTQHGSSALATRIVSFASNGFSNLCAFRYDYLYSASQLYTFTVRVGVDVGTLTINGVSGQLRFGGTMEANMYVHNYRGWSWD